MESKFEFDGPVLSEKGAGVYLGGERDPVSTRSLQRWRLEGVGPKFLKLGRLVRYRKSDLDKWVEAQLSTSTSESKRCAPR